MESSKTAQDIRGIAVAAVTSALYARQQSTNEERVQQFGHDFTMLLGDEILASDLFRLSSLLADMNGYFVELLAQRFDTDPTELMQYMAIQMMDIGITEHGPEEEN